ncbi:MAG TPA: hypothetical protein VG405_09065 [Solirubrobacteraceae bacterium]|jgi:hypothetical protein|nr:hypothetical protein [Solirubrobacteraceae bacterium]
MGRRRRRDPRPLPERRLAAALLATGLLVSGCGSAGRPPQPLAQRLCARAQQAAIGLLHGQVRVQVLSADPSDVRCRLVGGRIALAVEAQTSDQAWVEYDTEQSHFAQVFGPTNIHNQAEQPHYLTGVGSQAFWVPAQLELVSTNAQEGSVGTYVTVSVTHHKRGAAATRPIAAAAARAAIATVPPAR